MFHRVLICVLFVSPAAVAGDTPSSRAKAALALAVATQPEVVVTDSAGRTPTQAARAALAEALGVECDCGMCDKAKGMPISKTAVVAEKTTVEKLATYPDLEKRIKSLKPGESVRVFAGVNPIADDTYRGVTFHLPAAIPGDKPGIWRCWIDEKTKAATMQELHLTAAKK